MNETEELPTWLALFSPPIVIIGVEAEGSSTPEPRIVGPPIVGPVLPSYTFPVLSSVPVR